MKPLTFAELMQQTRTMFISWQNDEELTSQYSNEELQKEFLSCIQAQIGSDFKLFTKEQIEKLTADY
jgi:hypothetical protein